jgi:hypothetical protein
LRRSPSATPPAKNGAQKVDNYLQQVTTALRHTLSNAVLQGELGQNTDVEALTDYFMGVVLGMCLYSRSPASPQAMEKYIKTALAILD